MSFELDYLHCIRGVRYQLEVVDMQRPLNQLQFPWLILARAFQKLVNNNLFQSQRSI